MKYSLPNDLLFYCINLPRDRERKSRIEQQAQELGLDITFIKAVDGRTDQTKDFDYTLQKGILDWHGFSLSPPQIGCILSHRKCLEAFLKSKASYVVILEDDAKFQKDSLEQIPTLLSLKSWDLIKLETRHKKLRGLPLKTLSGGQILHASTKGDIGTTCLLYTKKGALKMLKTLDKLTLPIDVHIAHYACKNLTVLDIHPPLVISDDQGISSIRQPNVSPPKYRQKSFKKALGQGLWSLFRTFKALLSTLKFHLYNLLP